MVTIRLARTGAKKRPFYHLTVAESSVKRDGKFIERLGFFNPIAVGQSQRLKVDLERVDHWMSVGAQPSERAAHLIREARKSADAAPVQAAAEATESTEATAEA